MKLLLFTATFYLMISQITVSASFLRGLARKEQEFSTSFLRGLARKELECNCPTVTCVFEPCPYYECRGPNCVLVQPSEPSGGGTPCGPTTCQGNNVCCNESCGICTQPDGSCTLQFCDNGGGLRLLRG